MDARFKPGTM